MKGYQNTEMFVKTFIQVTQPKKTILQKVLITKVLWTYGTVLDKERR